MALEPTSRSQWPPAGVSPTASKASAPAQLGAQDPSGAGLALETGGNLAAILAKLSADPATQTTLAAILAKLIAAPATVAKQDDILTALALLATKLDTAIGHLADIETNTDRIP